ncbi:MAG: radical SAM protein [Lachnospiraceae bacterium]|nr:radical SAM protein [Lachnospiraceae bacterium]
MNFKERYLKKQREKSNIMAMPPFPRIVKIDICNICNYSCIFCPQAKQSGKSGNIDDQLCLKVIEDSYHAGAREICLSSTGEPLLNPNLEKYISWAKEIGYEYVFFNTNGYLMNKVRAENILSAGVDSIKFSINAGSAENYKLIHGIDGYTRVIDNLIQLSEIRNKYAIECKLYVSYIALKPTLQEAELLKSKIASYIDDFVVMNANNRGGSIAEIEELFVGNDDYSYSYPCSQLFHNMYISAEGYVNICCQDFENLAVVADVNEVDVKRAWNSNEFVAFREKYLMRDLEGTLCKNCIYGGKEYVIPLDKAKAYFKEDNTKKEKLQKRIITLTEKVCDCKQEEE